MQLALQVLSLKALQLQQCGTCSAVNKNKLSEIINIKLINRASGDKFFEFKLFKNQWTAITGKSGSGKTSFMDVITGTAFPGLYNKSLKTKKGELTIKNNELNKFIYLAQFNYIPNCPLIEYIANSNDSDFLKDFLRYCKTCKFLKQCF